MKLFGTIAAFTLFALNLVCSQALANESLLKTYRSEKATWIPFYPNNGVKQLATIVLQTMPGFWTSNLCSEQKFPAAFTVTAYAIGDNGQAVKLGKNFEFNFNPDDPAITSEAGAEIRGFDCGIIPHHRIRIVGNRADLVKNRVPLVQYEFNNGSLADLTEGGFTLAK